MTHQELFVLYDRWYETVTFYCSACCVIVTKMIKVDGKGKKVQDVFLRKAEVFFRNWIKSGSTLSSEGMVPEVKLYLFQRWLWSTTGLVVMLVSWGRSGLDVTVSWKVLGCNTLIWGERYLDVEPGRVLADCPPNLRRLPGRLGWPAPSLVCVGQQVASIARRDFIFHKYPLDWHLAPGTFAPSATSLPRCYEISPSPWQLAGGIKKHLILLTSGTCWPIIMEFLKSIIFFVNLLQRMYLGSLAAVGRPFWLEIAFACKCNAELGEKSQGQD